MRYIFHQKNQNVITNTIWKQWPKIGMSDESYCLWKWCINSVTFKKTILKLSTNWGQFLALRIVLCIIFQTKEENKSLPICVCTCGWAHHIYIYVCVNIYYNFDKHLLNTYNIPTYIPIKIINRPMPLRCFPYGTE